ncbi:hypothetical protein WISP_136240 [Willisornis vidua]|uniref:BTB domain-containing protein n=1 Tax=Willisornis vidua TaxID=1566151 RepID=A0ABQ9CSV3_9PASS|nr:hypothetical protein WISP_136240 [Willisornis vidua]
MGPGLIVLQGRFKLDVKKKFLTQRIVGDWNMLSREVVDYPSLEVIKGMSIQETQTVKEELKFRYRLFHLGQPSRNNVLVVSFKNVQEMLTGQRLCQSSSHNDAVLAALNQQRSDGILCDITLIAEEQKFHAHKAVLAACSDYFRFLTLKMKVFTYVKLLGPLGCVEFTDRVFLCKVSFNLVKLFCDDLLFAVTDMAVRLMCTNEEKLIVLMDMEHLSKKITQRQGAILDLTIVTILLEPGVIQDVLAAGSHLQLLELLSLCSHYLIETITMSFMIIETATLWSAVAVTCVKDVKEQCCTLSSMAGALDFHSMSAHLLIMGKVLWQPQELNSFNYLDLYKLADLFNLTLLENAVIGFLVKHLSELLKSHPEEVLALPYCLLREVFKSDRLTSLSEEQIWQGGKVPYFQLPFLTLEFHFEFSGDICGGPKVFFSRNPTEFSAVGYFAVYLRCQAVMMEQSSGEDRPKDIFHSSPVMHSLTYAEQPFLKWVVMFSISLPFLQCST